MPSVLDQLRRGKLAIVPYQYLNLWVIKHYFPEIYSGMRQSGKTYHNYDLWNIADNCIKMELAIK